jgi:ABC-type nitrate/sulfonate/bicarbonate transport system permease component
MMIKCFTKLFSYLLLFLAWQLMAWSVTKVKGVNFPMPMETFGRLISLLGESKFIGCSFYTHILKSCQRWG